MHELLYVQKVYQVFRYISGINYGSCVYYTIRFINCVIYCFQEVLMYQSVWYEHFSDLLRGQDAYLLWLTDWTITVICFSHIGHLACKHGLAHLFDAALSEDLWAVTAGCRNTATKIHGGINRYMLAHLRFRDHTTGIVDGCAKTFYAVLGASGPMLETLDLADPKVSDDGDFIVSSAMRAEADPYGRMSNAVAYAMTWDIFNDARWHSHWITSKQLLLSKALGLQHLVKGVRDKHAYGSFYLLPRKT